MRLGARTRKEWDALLEKATLSGIYAEIVATLEWYARVPKGQKLWGTTAWERCRWGKEDALLAIKEQLDADDMGLGINGRIFTYIGKLSL